MTDSVNKAFAIPQELEARLRAQAAAQVAAEFDETALLAQFVAEAKAAQSSELRAKALSILESPSKQVYDAHGFPEDYVEIMIYKGHGKTELSYVPVGVNGFFWKIRRGARVVVPRVVQHVLENAIGEEVVQAEGGLITQPVHRFPFQTIRDSVPKAEYLKARDAGRAAVASQTATASASA